VGLYCKVKIQNNGTWRTLSYELQHVTITRSSQTRSSEAELRVTINEVEAAKYPSIFANADLVNLYDLEDQVAIYVSDTSPVAESDDTLAFYGFVENRKVDCPSPGVINLILMCADMSKLLSFQVAYETYKIHGTDYILDNIIDKYLGTEWVVEWQPSLSTMTSSELSQMYVLQNLKFNFEPLNEVFDKLRKVVFPGAQYTYHVKYTLASSMYAIVLMNMPSGGTPVMFIGPDNLSGYSPIGLPQTPMQSGYLASNCVIKNITYSFDTTRVKNRIYLKGGLGAGIDQERPLSTALYETTTRSSVEYLGNAIAQKFTPTKNALTQVALRIAVTGNPTAAPGDGFATYLKVSIVESSGTIPNPQKIRTEGAFAMSDVPRSNCWYPLVIPGPQQDISDVVAGGNDLWIVVHNTSGDISNNFYSLSLDGTWESGSYYCVASSWSSTIWTPNISGNVNYKTYYATNILKNVESELRPINDPRMNGSRFRREEFMSMASIKNADDADAFAEAELNTLKYPAETCDIDCMTNKFPRPGEVVRVYDIPGVRTVAYTDRVYDSYYITDVTIDFEQFYAPTIHMTVCDPRSFSATAPEELTEVIAGIKKQLFDEISRHDQDDDSYTRSQTTSDEDRIVAADYVEYTVT
jgi:hypothetical protein